MVCLHGDHVRIHYANTVGCKCLFRKRHVAIYGIMIIQQAESTISRVHIPRLSQE